MIPIPAWIYGKLFAVAVTGLAGMALGGFLMHQWDGIALSRSQAETATAKADLASYAARVAAKTAKANADTLREREAAQTRLEAIQAELAQTRRDANAKSARLQALLASAKPGDLRPIGPIAADYYSRLRGP